MRKKLFAILMSAMMMVTFMPTMAFAATADKIVSVNKAVLSSDYTYATAEVTTAGGDTFTTKLFTTRDFWEGATSSSPTHLHGAIEVKFDTTAAGAGYTIDTDTAVSFKNDVYTGVKVGSVFAKYVDLTGAKVVNYDATTKKVAKAAVDADSYCDTYVDQTNLVKGPKMATGHDGSELLGEYVELVEPADLVEDGAKAAKAYVSESLFDTTYAPAAYEKYEEDGDRVVKVTWKDGDHTINADKAVVDHNLYIFMNAPQSVQVKFDGRSVTDTISLNSDVDYALGHAQTIVNGANYIGASQNLTLVTKGVTVQYSTDKGKTWTDAAPEMKAASETPYTFLMKVTRGSVTRYAYVSLTVHAANLTAKAAKTVYYFAPGQEVTVNDLFDVVLTFTGNKEMAVADADKEALAKYMAKYVKVTGIDNMAAGYAQTATLKFDNSATGEFRTDLKKDAELVAFTNNYNLGSFLASFNNDKVANINFVKGENDITAPNQTKTYHNKKGKLAKTYTFQLKDTAEFGQIKFTKMSGTSKVTVSSTGKVTVKKGLKKGTYTIKIKERVANTSAYSGATATKTLKIKLVK